MIFAVLRVGLNLLVATGLAFCPMIYPADRAARRAPPLVSLLPMSLGAELCWQAWATGAAPAAPLALLAAWALGRAGWVAVRARRTRLAD